MKKIKLVLSSFLVVTLFTACIATIDGSSGMSSPSIAQSPLSSATSSTIVAETPDEGRIQYDEYMERVQPAIDRFGGYSSTLHEDSSTEKMSISERQAIYRGHPAQITKFATEREEVLHFLIEFTTSTGKTHLLYYPVDSQLTYCQEAVLTWADWFGSDESDAGVWQYELYTRIRDDVRDVVYLTSPSLGRLVASDETEVMNLDELEMLFETGFEPSPSQGSKIEFFTLPEDLTTEEASRLYDEYSAQIQSFFQSNAFDKSTVNLEQRHAFYTNVPSLMTRITNQTDGLIYYFIESTAETRRGEEVFIYIDDRLTYTQLFMSVYANSIVTTNERMDSQEYQLYSLVRDEETGTTYQLIPELGIAVKFDDWDADSFESITRYFDEAA